MSLVNRAFRNIWRKKTRTILVACALAFSIAAIISVQAGVEASKTNTQQMIDKTTANTQAMINDTIEDYDIILGNVSEYMEDVSNMTAMQMSQISVSNNTFAFDRGDMRPPGDGGERPPGGWGGFEGGQRMQGNVSADILEGIMEINGVAGIVPSVTQQYREGGNEGETRFRMSDFTVKGIPLNELLNEQFPVFPTPIIDGRQFTVNDSGVVIIDQSLESYFDNASVGDAITIEDTDFTVIGICYTASAGGMAGGMFGRGGTVYMNISDAQDLIDMDSDEYSTLDVYAVNQSMVQSVVYDIEQNYSWLMVTSIAEMSSRFGDRLSEMQETQEERLWEQRNASIAQLQGNLENDVAQLEADMSSIESTGNQIVIVSAITAGLIVLFMMFYTVRERIREIGTLKAIGFSGTGIMTQFLTEGIIIGLIGGVIGIGIALVAAPVLSDVLLPSSEAFTTAGVSLWLLIAALCMTALLGAVGSLYPAWDASRRSPVEAMRHE